MASFISLGRPKFIAVVFRRLGTTENLCLAFLSDSQQSCRRIKTRRWRVLTNRLPQHGGLPVRDVAEKIGKRGVN